LVKEGYIEEEAALRVANRREDVASKLKSSAGAVG
jgi:hypothetical protein